MAPLTEPAGGATWCGTSTTIVPHGQTASGHRHPIYPEPPIRGLGMHLERPRPHSIFTHPVKHMFDHQHSQVANPLSTWDPIGREDTRQ
jgi:hypothetical protein